MSAIGTSDIVTMGFNPLGERTATQAEVPSARQIPGYYSLYQILKKIPFIIGHPKLDQHLDILLPESLFFMMIFLILDVPEHTIDMRTTVRERPKPRLPFEPVP